MNFKHSNRNRKTELWIVILLSITVFLSGSYLISKINHQFDLSSNSSFSLSNETLAALDKIDQPIDILVTLEKSSATPKVISKFSTDINILLDQFESQVKGQKIRIHRLNIDHINPRNNSIAEKYNLRERNIIAVASPEIGKKVIFRYKQNSTSNPYDTESVFRSSDSLAREALWESEFYTDWKEAPGGILEPTLFRGEAVITRSILNLIHSSSDKPNKVYFTVGHGEKSPEDNSGMDGFSTFRQLIEDKNLQVSTVDLTSTEGVPKDAKVLIINGPQVSFHESEINYIRQFINHRGGNVLTLLDPVDGNELSNRPAFGLRPLLKEWGIRCHDMLIYDDNHQNFDIFSNSYFVRTFPQGLTHKITQEIINLGSTIKTGRCRPVEVISKKQNTNSIELLYSSSNSWALSNWTNREMPPIKNSLLDIDGPVPILVISELSNDGSENQIKSSGKLAVLGCSETFNNKNLRSSTANQMLSNNLIYWFIEKNEMLNIKPRPLSSYSLTLSPEQFMQLSYALCIIPLASLLFGLFINWLRKDI